MRPSRSLATSVHSTGSTFPLVLSMLTSVWRLAISKGTCGGAARRVASQITTPASATKPKEIRTFFMTLTLWSHAAPGEQQTPLGALNRAAFTRVRAKRPGGLL